MCIIIYRPRNVELDYRDFETCVMNNPDGFGFCVPDGDGMLYTQRSADTPDPKELWDLLHGEFKKEDVLIHLRYTTAGETVVRNAHPFPVMEKAKHGVDMRMMHNGTLSKYKPSNAAVNKWESDTRVFTREFLRPVVQRMALAIGAENVADDNLTEYLIDDQLTASSVVVLMDGNGRMTFVNALGNGGFFDTKGCYFSNKYSFDAGHRTTQSYPTRHVTPTKVDSFWDDDHDYNDWAKPKVLAPPAKDKGDSMSDVNTTKFSDTFSDEFGIDGLEDMLTISDETIAELVKDPEASSSFIKEMLCNAYELYQTVSAAQRQVQVEENQRKKTEALLYDANMRVAASAKWIAEAKEGKKDGKAA